MRIDYSAIGKRIRNYRKKENLTQTDLGKRTNLSASYIGHIERGTRIPSVKTLSAIADSFNITIDMLITALPLSIADSAGISFKNHILISVVRVLNEHADEWLPSN